MGVKPSQYSWGSYKARLAEQLLETFWVMVDIVKADTDHSAIMPTYFSFISCKNPKSEKYYSYSNYTLCI
jgi:hypothetical protein